VVRVGFVTLFIEQTGKVKLCTYILRFLFVLTVFSSCEKEIGSKGNVLVTVKYNTDAIAQARVYLKRGSDTTSVILPINFDKQTGADAIGQSYFENLLPDIYTIFVVGYSQQASKLVTGKVVIQIRARCNKVTVETN
jgi:hypothetical protein